MYASVFYTGGELDRAGVRRRDEAWVAERLGRRDTLVVPVWRNRSLITGGAAPEAALIAGGDARKLIELAGHVALLGLDGETAVAAIDLSDHEQGPLSGLVEPARFMDLRRAAALMERSQASLLAHARGMMHWHRNHLFCGACGGAPPSPQGAHLRVCGSFGHAPFPRPDPAVLTPVGRVGACPAAADPASARPPSSPPAAWGRRPGRGTCGRPRPSWTAARHPCSPTPGGCCTGTGITYSAGPAAAPPTPARAVTCGSCGNEHFPRTDPAVIMLVVRDGACLLARKPEWPDAMYSTLAGFVEPGESLEEAVAREVFEETAVTVRDVRYRASQPWPFPASLMLGFRARATTTRIQIDGHELAHARWFKRADLAHGRHLPRADSIARWLIDEWLAEGRDSRK